MPVSHDRQCAWCGCLTDAQARPFGAALPLARERSHGICRDCHAAELARIGGVRS